MTRPLETIDSADAHAVMHALERALSGDGPAILPVESLLREPQHPVPVEVERRVALVVQTSGSTGKPKRVALTADAVLASAAASEGSLGGPGQWMLALPAHYIAGLNVLARSLTAGTQPLILPPGHFDPTEFLALSLRMDAPARYTSLVPAQLAALVDAADQDDELLEPLRRFDRILVGGQATRPELVERCLELGLNVSRTYGSSETSGGCVYDGLPIGPVRVRIADGEVQLGGPVLAEGYLDDPARTAASFFDDEGRWYRTGDTGRLDGDVLTVTGRLDGLIISGGVKVSLEAVERVVRGLPGLADSVVVKAPSERWGEVPVVVTTGGGVLAEVRAAVAEALDRASAPAAIVTVERLPQLSSGKPDRLALGVLAAEATGGA